MNAFNSPQNRKRFAFKALAMFAIAILVVLGLSRLPAQSFEPTAPLFDNLGDRSHPISTPNPLAQRYFDQGLALAYGFNHAEAERSFLAAAQLDPDCAICYWGAAWVLGPNINAPMSDEAVPEAWENLQKALELQGKASDRDRAYIQALAARYAPEPTSDRSALDLAFAEAMEQVARNYPDDLDAATVQAEALMDTSPWDYWQENGQPKAATSKILAALESVLERDPNHPGANHLYIHAVEASPHPERGEAAADRLGPLVPDAGHLVHMPGHIYLRTGRYHDAALANESAIAADESYIAKMGAEGFYTALYYTHNLHFLSYAAAMEGRSQIALDSARKLASNISPEQAQALPLLEWLVSTPHFVMARFGQWDDLLQEPQPPANLRYVTAMWHYVRGLAFAGQGELAPAEREMAALRQISSSEGIEALEIPFLYGVTQMEIAENVLSAEIARLKGQRQQEIRALEAAVTTQETLPYMEPPYWYFPTRQFLGAALLAADRPQAAEVVYRQDLKAHPRNGWSLLGLAQSLRSQGQTAAASVAREDFERAWQNADASLTASRF